MIPDPNDFALHDVHGFPLVWARPQDGADPDCWGREMDALIAQGTPFVALHAGDAHDENHAERKARALWFKRNKAALARVCRAVIAVQENALKRAALQVQALPMSQAFGIRMAVVASRAEAENLAWDILFEGPDGY